MEVISLGGTDDRLYELVARLVMSPEVLRQNNNYPFKTGPEYTWYICLSDGEVVGFMPGKNTSGGLYLDNYYIRDDNLAVLEALVSRILSGTDKTVTVLSHKRHSEAFGRHGFARITIFAQYDRMRREAGKGDGGE